MSNSSRPQDRIPERNVAIEKAEQSFLPRTPEQVAPAENLGLPGSMNDAGLVQQLVTLGMKRSGLSRAQIADRMCYLTGTPVTEAQLNNFSADSRPDVRFPLQFLRAFASAVGDDHLLTSIAALAGLHLVDETGLQLMELGREFLKEKRAAESRAAIETKLRGVDLG